MRGIVIDIETTGFAINDAIISLSMLKFNSNTIEEIYHTLINPGRRIPENIVKLTGITNEMVIGYPLFGNIKPDFIKFIKGYSLFAYNAPFEAKFLGNLVTGEEKINDVLVVARKTIDLDKYSLFDVANHFSFRMREMKNTHQSLEDALICYRVILALTNLGAEWQF